MSLKLKHSIFLILAAAIWGFAFAFQRLGGSSMGPYTFNAFRSILGYLVIQPVIKITSGELKPNRATVRGGILCGLALSAACNLQQVGLMYTSPGKAGFITAVYMIFVAVFGLFSKKKPAKATLLAIVLGAIGLYYICMPQGENLSMNLGDILCIGCALFYAVQIIIIDRNSEGTDPLKMSSIQFLIAGAVSLILAFAFEKPMEADIAGGLIPLLYVGIMSTGVAYSLQMVGMRGVDPAVASLLMSLESVFSVVGEFVIFRTMLSGKSLIGCVIMFAAVLLSQMQPGKEHECTE